MEPIKDRSLEIKHWQNEIRNAMYHLTDEHLTAMLLKHFIERNRLRRCLPPEPPDYE